jgi:hypothetical protein
MVASAVVLGLVLLGAGPALAQSYAVRAAPLRAAPTAGATVVERVDANQDLAVLARSGDWVQVRAGVDLQGWLPAGLVSDRWLQVWKRERQLHLMKGVERERSFRVALAAGASEGTKLARGDRRTPEGRYFIAEPDRTPASPRHGARSLRLSYPSAADARLALAGRRIDRATYLAIVRAVRAGETPPQKTALGGSIRIHGGGSAADWTLGCIALDDADVTWLFDRVGKGTRVDVYASAEEASRRSAAGFTARAVLAGAEAQLAAPALYTAAAMRAASIGFPGGDIDRGQAVCTDIVVRALRVAGLDLQALVFEDRSLHPELYRDRGGPKPAVDHRRVRTLVPFLRRFAAAGDMKGQGELQPGDIVIFDTGIANGTPFDHIGIVDVRTDLGPPDGVHGPHRQVVPRGGGLVPPRPPLGGLVGVPWPTCRRCSPFSAPSEGCASLSSGQSSSGVARALTCSSSMARSRASTAASRLAPRSASRTWAARTGPTSTAPSSPGPRPCTRATRSRWATPCCSSRATRSMFAMPATARARWWWNRARRRAGSRRSWHGARSGRPG